MFGQKPLLNINGGNGGAGGVFKGKTAGQDMNISDIINKFKGGLEGHIEGTMALRGKQLLLGYVAAVHPSNTVRALAMRDIDDPTVLCTVIWSSPHTNSVSKAFEKLEGKLGMLGDRERFMVAMRAPSGEMRREALELMRKNFHLAMIPERGMDYDDIISGVDWAEKRQTYTVLHSVEILEREVLGGSPFTQGQLDCRTCEFVPENLEVLLSRG
jgi:hypothetical protein